MKNLKLPSRSSVVRDYFDFMDSEYLFLDFTLILDIPAFQCYQLAFPNVKGTPTQIKARARELMNMPSAKEYLEVRGKQLEKHYFSTDADTEAVSKVVEEVKALPENWKDVLYSNAWRMVEEGQMEAKSVELLFKKALTEIEVGEVVELPRRYLPTTCSDCRYRQWIESNCEEV